MNPSCDRTLQRDAVLSALARLREAFPLERRVRAAPLPVQQAYAVILQHWLGGQAPGPAAVAPEHLNMLAGLDAVVPGPDGLGCYPFSARETGIHVHLPGGTVPAMCAVDALAVARLAATRLLITAGCAVCNTALTCRVEANGSLDHDQTEVARVIWKTSSCRDGSCSESLCRNLLFLCPACSPPAGSDCFTLPQATAIGNAFFSFQQGLLGHLTSGAA